MKVFERHTDQGFVVADGEDRVFIQLFGIGLKGVMLRIAQVNAQILATAEKTPWESKLIPCQPQRLLIGQEADVWRGVRVSLSAIDPNAKSATLCVATSLRLWRLEDWRRDEPTYLLMGM